MSAKVGVFMPCYNLGDYIDEALDSLYEQTFTDFTVIIADDASPQKRTISKLQTISRPRCKIYYEKKNLGLIKISNKYMSLIDAEFIMLYSPDDKMDPQLLQEQVQYLDTNPDVHAVCTWVQEFGDGDGVIKYNDELCTLPQMLISNHFCGAALVRKSAWIAAGKHDTNKDLFPNLDYDLWLSMLEKGFKLGTIQKPLFYWRVTRDSLSHRVNPDQILVFRKALLKKYTTLYKKHSEFVISYYLNELSRFEKYYIDSEEGHEWLDKQYHNLTKQNAQLNEHNRELVNRLNQSIQRPYIRSILGKIRKFCKRRLKSNA